MSKGVFINHIEDQATFFILISAWNKVRDKFTQEEKDALNAGYAGETLCPRGIIVEYRKVPDGLMTKVREALESIPRQK